MATTTMTTVALRSVRCGAGQDSPLASPSGSQCECSGRASSAQMRSVASPAPGKLLKAVAALPSQRSSSSAEGANDDDFCFAAACARLGLAGLAAAALVWTAAPAAMAYKGGGPYGIEVTRGQDLSGKDFSGRTLIKQDFKTSILRQANFKGAKLLGASFFDSDLTGADLTDADLRGVDFSLANVAKANLTNANLEGATVTGNTSFKGAIITGADFTDVLWRDDQRVQLCRSAGGVNSTTGNATRETLLCE